MTNHMPTPNSPAAAAAHSTWQERVLRAYKRIHESDRTDEVLGAEDFIRRELLKHGEELLNAHATLVAQRDALLKALIRLEAYCGFDPANASRAEYDAAIKQAQAAIAKCREGEV